MPGVCLLALLLGSAAAAGAAGFDGDPEAQKLRDQFTSLTVVGPALQDDYDTTADRQITGLVTLEDGKLSFPEDRSEGLYVYYGLVLPRRGRLGLAFRLDQIPKDHNFMTLCSVGTAGNTKFMVRLGLDRRVRVILLTRREEINLESDPVERGQWHRLEWWYAPEGSLLLAGIFTS